MGLAGSGMNTLGSFLKAVLITNLPIVSSRHQLSAQSFLYREDEYEKSIPNSEDRRNSKAYKSSECFTTTSTSDLREDEFARSSSIAEGVLHILSMPSQNFGLIREGAGNAVVQAIPIPKLRDDYILVKTITIALNPTD